METERGSLIAIEGCDKSGKSYLCYNLQQYFNNQDKIVFASFPHRSSIIGRVITRLLTHQNKKSSQTLHLLFAANRWEKKEFMEDLLNKGFTLIIDRYVHSGLVYSLADDMNKEWTFNLTKGLIKPDLVLYIDRVVKNIGSTPNPELFETEEFQFKAHELYNEIQDPNWHKIDANKSLSKLMEEVVPLIENEIKREKGPLDFF